MQREIPVQEAERIGKDIIIDTLKNKRANRALNFSRALVKIFFF